jgi:hypothetical protein
MNFSFVALCSPRKESRHAHVQVRLFPFPFPFSWLRIETTFVCHSLKHGVIEEPGQQRRPARGNTRYKELRVYEANVRDN